LEAEKTLSIDQATIGGKYSTKSRCPLAMDAKEKPKYILGLKGNALVTALTEFVIDCGIFLTDAFWSLYVLALDATITDLGLLSLVTGLLPALFIAPAGLLGDRVSRKKVVVYGGILSGIGPILNAFAPSWLFLVPGALLSSINPIIRPARQALMADDISPEERGKAFSTVFTLMMLPDTFMPPLAGLILDQTGLAPGMRYLLITSGTVRISMALIRQRLIKERKNTSAAKNSRPRSYRGVFYDMARPLTSIGSLRVMLVGSVMASFSMGLMMRLQSVYAVGVLGLTNTEWGLILSGVGIVRVATRIPLGSLSDRWGRRRSILINYFLQPPTVVAFALSRDLVALFISLAARIVAFNFGGAAWEAMIVDVTPAEIRGAAYGVMGTFEMGAQSSAPLLGGFLWETLAPEWVFYIAALGRTCAAATLFKYLREPERRQE